MNLQRNVNFLYLTIKIYSTNYMRSPNLNIIFWESLSKGLLKTVLTWTVLPGLMLGYSVSTSAKYECDFLSCVFLFLLLTLKPCHICHRHGRHQLYGFLQCGLAYSWMELPFHKCCRRPCTLCHRQIEHRSLSSLTGSGRSDLAIPH